MTLNLLHTADWQIGKQFARIAGDAGAMLRAQRLETIRALAVLARERRVDAVLVAGTCSRTTRFRTKRCAVP